MDEWEAKYKILASGIADSKSVENAERLVGEAVRLSKRRGASLESVIDLMLQAARLDRPKSLGFPVEAAEWLPADHAMIFGKFGAVIMNFETGECKVASKEDLEKALRNVTEEKE